MKVELKSKFQKLRKLRKRQKLQLAIAKSPSALNFTVIVLQQEAIVTISADVQTALTMKTIFLKEMTFCKRILSTTNKGLRQLKLSSLTVRQSRDMSRAADALILVVQKSTANAISLELNVQIDASVKHVTTGIIVIIMGIELFSLLSLLSQTENETKSRRLKRDELEESNR